MKPLGHKNYGSIPHLPNSRLGEGDHRCAEGHARIATEKVRDKYDRLIVTEKLDGSNVGVALLDGILYPLTRSGYVANTSRWKMHHIFNNWVFKNEDRFRSVLKEGERLCGEWLLIAHGTRYKFPHEPFVIFDIMYNGHKRVGFDELKHRVGNVFTMPFVISDGNSLSTDSALKKLGTYGQHGALEQIEGAVWRIERKGKVDFLVKYVRQDKEDGKYLKDEIYNEFYGTV